MEQETKNNPGPEDRAIDALILGIVSIFLTSIHFPLSFFVAVINLVLTGLHLYSLTLYVPRPYIFEVKPGFLSTLLDGLWLFSPIAAIVGIILGSRALNSTRKIIAIIAIIFCIISLLGSAFTLFFAAWYRP